MYTDIPLKIRVGIRDQWDSPQAPIHSAKDSLTKALGHVITPQVEWPTLYASLKDTFSEPSTFVPAICRIAIAFYGRLLSRLGKEPDTPWTEDFLEGMTKRTNWKLQMEVNDEARLQRPQLLWNLDTGNFCIHIPRCNLPAGNSVIEAGFDEDLDGFFGRQPQNPVPTRTEMDPISELTKEDNWTDIGDADESRTNTSREAALPQAIFIPFPPATCARQVESKIEDLPVADVVSRPAKLFKSIAPYILTVNATKIPLLIQGSHQPSLEYIANYLKKWGRIDQNNTSRRSILKVEMVESAFFSDVRDTITIEPSYYRGDPEPLNPTLILGFIEGVLGYKEMFTNGTRWVFKLDPESHSETSLFERNRRIL